VSGSATALVVRTGPATRFGDIARRLATRPPETEFERGLRRFTHLILETVVFLTLFIAVISIAMRRDPLQSMLFAVALAVGLVPEFLPMITTVTLANGAVRMARRHVIVKHLPAIQNLGSIDVLCSDKTGTLTSGDVRYAKAVDAAGAPSVRTFALGWLNAKFETGVRSPLDAAILREPPPNLEPHEKLDEMPFDFERRRLTVVVAGPDGPVVVTKGAPEAVLTVCTRFESGPSDEASPQTITVTSQPLDDVARDRVLATVHALCEDGYRVLAVASRRVERAAAYTKSDERDLDLAGLLAFRDPPLPGTSETVNALARDGVRIVVLSGDEGVITRQVCAAVGLPHERIVLGSEIESMTDIALAHVAEHVTAFARLTPGQKTRVISALRGRGHVVGFLGDGINDAPALHAADVGISVSTAVDVAKDAADVILMEPGLGVLHAGIIEGRTAFGNTMKYLLMGTSSNFGNMFSMAVASIALPFLPMLPTQILLNNFLYDVAQVTIPTDRVDAEYLAKPHRWDMHVLRAFMLRVGPVSSIFDFLTFYVLLKVFHAGEQAFHTGWFMESLTTQTLVLFSIRTVRSPLRSRPSRALAATVLGVVVFGLVLPLTPLAGPLSFVRMPWSFYGFIAAATTVYIVLADAVKRPLMRRFLTVDRKQ
jgi:Mg2+-importing ATPase